SLNVAATFYNAMLRDVSCERTVGRVSALGVGVAELGIIAGLALLPMVWRAGNYGRVFASAGVALLAASLPLILFVREQKDQQRVVNYGEARRRSWSDLKRVGRFVVGNH